MIAFLTGSSGARTLFGKLKDGSQSYITSAMLRGVGHLPKVIKQYLYFIPYWKRGFASTLVGVGSHPNIIMNLVSNVHKPEDTDVERLKCLSKK